MARKQGRRVRDAVGTPSGIVAIVGRPNVGKSTLFNRLIGERRAIVDEFAGLTRDRLYGVTEWGGRAFTVVDTAGLVPEVLRNPARGDEIASAAQAQARAAMAEADVCCFMVDVRDGVTPVDLEVAAIMRQGTTPVVLVGNKADSHLDPYFSHELFSLGLGEPFLISALQGKDTGDLLDQVVSLLPPQQSGEEKAGIPAWEWEEGDVSDARDAPDRGMSVAIVGRPNVGKSSLLNRLLGEERSTVSNIPGTTRDTVDTVLVHDGRRIRLVDTAGIRRRGVVTTDIEHYSLLRSMRAIERAEVVLLVVDSNEGVVVQDRHIAGYAVDAGKGVVVVANKWDLLDEEKRSDKLFRPNMQQMFDFIPDVPVLTVSALTGRHSTAVLDAAVKVGDARKFRIPTSALNNAIRRAVEEHPPRVHKGLRLKILYAAQAAASRPTIVLFVNDPEQMHFAYERYLENRLRQEFGFAGTRLRFVLRKRGQE